MWYFKNIKKIDSFDGFTVGEVYEFSMYEDDFVKDILTAKDDFGELIKISNLFRSEFFEEIK